jgi:hypothetical protein
MPGPEERRARRERSGVRRRGLRLVLRILLGAALLGLVFFLGLAVGRAVQDAPRPGGTQTIVRTLEPGTAPPEELTVTVTVSGP